MKLVISREAFQAYERRAGFPGLGDFFVQRGLLEYREDDEEPSVAPTASMNPTKSTSQRGPSTVLPQKEKNVISTTR